MDTKVLKAIAHHLEPIVTIGDNGLSSGVIAELKRAISDHELIKVRLNVGDRELRRELANDVAELLCADLVQQIGKIFVVYQPTKQSRPARSNITRFGH
ncbi:MAG: YhbY family RNA-binding protein [Pseudomonadota bacterium]|nr:YhbY family RNA-binding protein [Pseudomonadota bacterium]